MRTRIWRKGCFCGCLNPDECQYLVTDDEPDEQVVVVHVHHHNDTRQAPLGPPTVIGEVIDEDTP